MKTTIFRENPNAARSVARRSRPAAGLLFLALSLGAWAQLPEGTVTGFKVGDVDPTSGKLKSLLSGGSVTNISNTELKITGGVRMVIFGRDGQTNLTISSPECLYNTQTETATSPEKLLAMTGDGRFSLEGQGFVWRKTNASLNISNQVHATVRKDLIDSRTKTGAVAVAASAIPAAARTNLSAPDLVHIYSDRFFYQSNSAAFSDSVRVEEPQGKVTCGVLTVQFAEPSRRIEHIVAEQDVRIEAGKIHATGEKAIYRLTEDDDLTLTGKPTWQIEQQKGSAEELVFDHRTREFRAVRNVHMQLPPAAMSQALFLPGRSVSVTNSQDRQPIDVFADYFELKPDIAMTNVSVALFRDNVRINNHDGGEELSCRLMTVKFSSTDSQAEDASTGQKVIGMVAERDVVVVRGENRVTADKAVYTADTGKVEMTGQPAWRVEQREGSAELLIFDLKNKAYQARHNVQMQLPPGSFGRAAWLLPGATTGTNLSAARISTSVSPRPVEITADEFKFLSAGSAQKTDVASYRGNVSVSDAAGMTLRCDVLTTEMLAGKNQVQEIIAERNVEVTVIEPGSFRQAKGDRATYRADPEELELTADAGVEIVLIDTSGASHARGEKVVYDGTRNVMNLVGSPRVLAPQATAEGDLVVLDQANTTLKVTGNWKVKLPIATLKSDRVPAPRDESPPLSSRPVHE